MSSSLKERIIGALIKALIVGVLIFMLLCIDYKLFNYRKDWLPHSLMWAISWSIGCFVSETMAEATANKSIIKVIVFKAIISFIVTMLMAFVTGVIIGLSNWDYIVSNTCVPFAASLLINIEWKRD